MSSSSGSSSSGSASAAADPADNRASDLIEAGFGGAKLPESPSLSRMSAAARHFGDADALIHGLSSNSDESVFKGCALLGRTFAEKHFYARGGGEYLKCDREPWEGLSLAATPGACKFIKDENEHSAIMDAPGTSFDLPPDMSARDADRKLRLGISDAESAGFTPAAGAGPGLEGSPDFLVDLHHPDQLPALSQVTMYRSEAPRWAAAQTCPGETQYWCQAAGATEDRFAQSGYDGIHAQGASHRNPPHFSPFPGMPPQRQCVICADEASGCHYGVLTCGSCKVFFKRAVEGHHSYLCAGRNDCIVDKIRRKNCPACRLRKCYQAGMMLGGRKLKRFGALKALGLVPSLMFQSHLSIAGDSQALASASYKAGVRELQLNQQVISILENIEPETVFAGHDSCQSDVAHLLLTSLNRLCEQQLMWIVKWSKSLPGFRNLHITDQMTLIQFSWMNLMVFSLGWRSFQNVTSEYLYFAPDMVLSQEQMRKSPIYDLCLAIQVIPQEFSNLHVTREEFLCMKAIILLSTVPLEGLKSQAAFEEMRQNYIRELTKVIHTREKGVVASSQRFYRLTKLMDSMHEIVKKVNLFCLTTFIQAETLKVEFPEMMSEVIASQLPKVLAGMVRPLLFHTK